ncbi:MAG: arylamine N-acetyltransferase [Alphaproteobacteria bacterium]|nr:arylamine N-acetyltransferase [Alphaproteobacteria bacterium]
MLTAPPDEVDGLLSVLGLTRQPASAPFLAQVQRAWALTQPFHNLDLLAQYAEGQPPFDRRGAWGRCVQGLGGPCHVQASSFLLLVQALGFDAHFASAHITHPGDHLTVCVHVDGSPWLCDLGNGHPYLDPVPFDRPSRQSHLGWDVRGTPVAGGVLVEQITPGTREWRRVYVASTGERVWGDFEDAIARHHREPDFGPFLRGLRAIRVAEDHAVSLRDDVLTRYRRDGIERATVATGHEAILVDELGMSRLPVALAVETWRRNSERST